ncbi:MAG: hypothetical protein IJ604_01440 [Prevotella sp.]|nr:hypothetical protein [Prevotella sp.]
MNEETTKEKLQLMTYIESLQNAIGITLSLIPAEESEEDSRILRSLHGINEVKSYLTEKLKSFE